MKQVQLRLVGSKLVCVDRTTAAATTNSEPRARLHETCSELATFPWLVRVAATRSGVWQTQLAIAGGAQTLHLPRAR